MHEMMMDDVSESSKWRGGFLSTINKSFRLKKLNSPVGNKTTAMPTGLNSSTESTSMRPLEIVEPRIDTYRFSMANLEETQDSDLDAILGELSALDSEYDEELSRVSTDFSTSTKDRVDEEVPQHQEMRETDGSSVITRTDSPDNYSTFSDTVSMLSSESSASSSASSKCKPLRLLLHPNQKKADKIKLALNRMREANIKKLFVKTFSNDGSSKSLLVDEKMTCGYVMHLLAEKHFVTMEPKWAIVEQLPDLHMERVYEDHEMLVDNLMLWTRDSKNRLLFAERPEKNSLFQTPEKFLINEDDQGWSSDHDDNLRQVIIDDFFCQSSTAPSISGHIVPPMEGFLYLKSDAKKGWKKYYFVLRPSGLYYVPKDKVKTLKELVCLATFHNNEVYVGINWKKKYKSPTDFCFAIKHPRLQQPKSVKFIKFLCADDQETLYRWTTAMRIAKHGKQLLENYRLLSEEFTQEDVDQMIRTRYRSMTSIPTKSSPVVVNNPVLPTSSNASVTNSDISGRHSRASSSSSSGCLSDGGTASESAFDCEFPMGTIKRKPSMKPNIPLTWTTRQLKEMAEKDESEGGDSSTLTRRPRQRDDTLKRHAGENWSKPENESGDCSTLTRRPRHSLETSESTVYSSGSLTSSSPVNESYSNYETFSRTSVDTASSLYGYTIYDKSQPEEFPPPPPEDTTEMFSSTLSLDSLKKWQVAQKCKLEPTTTPHEVLGFREYPLSDDYKETSVSMWVQEHYGAGSVEDPFYENIYGRDTLPVRREEPKPIKKRPPPAPPKRSDSTHLTTQSGVHLPHTLPTSNAPPHHGYPTA